MDATIRHCWQKLTGEMVEAIKTDSKPEPSFYEGMRL
jgi:hypothetical protein